MHKKATKPLAKKILIVAEAGVNHNGELKFAKKLIEGAKEAGADLVKFQTFQAHNLAKADAPKAQYQITNTKNKSESQFAMLKKLELSERDHQKLLQHCREVGITFLSTPFDEESADLLEKWVPFYKIPSGEVTNTPFLEYLAGKEKPIVLSTGMCTLEEIQRAKAAIEKVWKKKQFALDQLTILQCTTNYPASFHEINLKAMQTLSKTFKVPVGFSDHSLGIEAALAAAALGAVMIEKHFTLDKNLPGPDHRASLSVEELKQMIQSIRHIEQALGDGVKKPSAEEKKNIPIARRGLYYREHFPKGKVLSMNDFMRMRPCPGLTPMDFTKLIGRPLKKAVKKHQPAQLQDFQSEKNS